MGNFKTKPIGHIGIDPFVAAKTNYFRGKKPDAAIPMDLIEW